MNSITMKMQADKLIRMALQEDITSEDVSTNAVMRSAVKGTVDLIAKEDGIIAGLDVYARVFQILDEKTEISFNFKDGDAVKKGDLLGTVTGDIRVLLSGERVIPMVTGDCIQIRRADVKTKILKLNHLSFVEVLRRKMRDS